MSVHLSNTNPAAPGGQSLVTFQIDKATGDISAAYTASSGGSGGVNEQTSSYPIVSGDKGKIVVMKGSSLTATLPAAPPSSTWSVFVANIHATTTLTISRNGLLIDDLTSDLTLPPYTGVYITTDGTNWFTDRGLGSVTHTAGPLTLGQLVIGQANGEIFVGDLTGDVTTSGSTATTIAPLAVTTGKIAAAAVTEVKIGLSNNTTNDVTTSQHGFTPKLPGNSGVYLDGNGNYTTPPGTGGGNASSASTTSLSYTAGEVKNFTLNMAKMFALFQVTEATGKKFRLQLYATSAARAADASRPYSVAIPLGQQQGILLDLYIDQVNVVTPWLMSPTVFGSNGDAVPPTTTNIYASVTNIDSSTQSINVTVNFVILET